MDEELYMERHLIECFFNKIKRYRRIALRCEKTLASFRACPVASVIGPLHAGGPLRRAFRNPRVRPWDFRLSGSPAQ